MTEKINTQGRAENLKKLGIREIQERLEVSPIITDPGTFDMNAEDTGGKNYNCDIVIHSPDSWSL